MRWFNRKNAPPPNDATHVEIVFNGGPFDGQAATVPRGLMIHGPLRVKRYTTNAVLHWYESIGPWTGKRVLHLIHRGVAGRR